jgi:nitroreductase
MDIYEAIRARKSVRAYKDIAVEEGTLERIFEAVRLAPSARNAQEWRFVVVRDKATRERIATEAAAQPFIGQAGAVIACCAEAEGRIMRCGQAPAPIDVAIAMDHLSLAAVAEGLGTCWIGSFDEAIVKRILGIPASVRVIQLMSLGVPVDGSPVWKQRMDRSQIVRYEGW